MSIEEPLLEGEEQWNPRMESMKDGKCRGRKKKERREVV
jgi:hypothetical protein